MLSNSSESQLMAQIESGSHAAFTELVTRHSDRFFALAFRSLGDAAEAEDIVQNAFIKLWQNPTSWNASKSKFTTWFYRVVINACHDCRRSSSRNVYSSHEQVEAASPMVVSEQTNADARQQETQQREVLEFAISQLPSSQSDAINLVVYLEMPQKQAAEIMGISLKALESLLVRGKRSMTKTVNTVLAKENIGNLEQSRRLTKQ